MRLVIFILPVRRPRPKFNDKVAKIFCSRSRKTCGNNFRFHFYCVSPHLCEILIAILSVHPPVTFRCSKKQQTHRKADGAKRPVSGRNVQVAKRTGAKRPGGETSWGRNVQGAKRLGGETSRWRNVQGAKRPVKGRNVKGAKRPVTCPAHRIVITIIAILLPGD